ncbi:DEAD/DEAH box helicase [Actinoallomurus rhizosphaericola]|uniref:DEAD/DEAH box helicase n=1 Tax=Actinoallomurus rhizosphaericola TaxID=2952536 RepID=UPI0020928961|nr:DEAD/DEAH box helicase [Actinoallomurus rhizosphaericola]MCO5996278.1 DEAD/DEAH box helicase [Actinoallomurus rhizosphaericola]
MNRTEREQLRHLVADFRRWSERAAGVQAWRQAVSDAARNVEQVLHARSVVIGRAGESAWRVVPLGRDDAGVVRRLRERAYLPVTTTSDQDLLRLLTDSVPRALADVTPVLGVRRLFTGVAKRQKADEAAEYLRSRHAMVAAKDGPQRLERMSSFTAPVDRGEAGFAALLDPALAFDLLPGRDAAEPEILDRSAVDGLAEALDVIDRAVAGEASYRKAAHHAGQQVRDADVRRVLQEMPVEALKEATGERLRLGPLTQAGIRTVQEVLDRRGPLHALPGIGEASARHMLGAARTLRQTAYDEMPVRIDVGNRRPETTELLRRLAEWDACRQTRGAAAELERAAELAPLRAAIGRGTSYLLVIPTRTLPVAGLRESIDIVKRRAALLGASPDSRRRGSAGADPWEDFLARPADYFAMLSELGFLTENEDAAHGDLPEEIVKAVRDQALSGEYLTASLRGYQSFAARFALVQHKVIIGDEMGLGKSVEALAVLAHLRSRGETHFLVICPAAVVTNWIREVGEKSKLRPHRVHGPEREHAARAWVRDGGVAVTTYETLAWWESATPNAGDLACVVVDEAHYIKNPEAQRTIRTNRFIARCDRVLLLTGTPMENRVDEFRNLASYIRPDLVVDATDLSPIRFRRQIAPAYLRRNQEDVLTELPELIEVAEWLPMTTPDAVAYRAAVEEFNFMQMRQAAMLQGSRSAKVQRLTEIVREAEANGRRVIVFSYFREVLDLVARSLRGPVFGPLTGSVAAHRRQRMVDDFASAGGGAVLVAQIVAGGVGLNIQSASVVVICEPQLKPTTEAQAIARAHRMGQVHSVQVHRLLSEDSVDQRIVELLAGKQRLFDDFARVSAMADSTPEAVDLSEADLVRQVIAAERRRLAERAPTGS